MSLSIALYSDTWYVCLQLAQHRNVPELILLMLELFHYWLCIHLTGLCRQNKEMLFFQYLYINTKLQR